MAQPQEINTMKRMRKQQETMKDMKFSLRNNKYSVERLISSLFNPADWIRRYCMTLRMASLLSRFSFGLSFVLTPSIIVLALNSASSVSLFSFNSSFRLIRCSSYSSGYSETNQLKICNEFYFQIIYKVITAQVLLSDMDINNEK